jgi:hypothetical protein
LALPRKQYEREERRHAAREAARIFRDAKIMHKLHRIFSIESLEHGQTLGRRPQLRQAPGAVPENRIGRAPIERRARRRYARRPRKIHAGIGTGRRDEFRFHWL